MEQLKKTLNAYNKLASNEKNADVHYAQEHYAEAYCVGTQYFNCKANIFTNNCKKQI